jgi:hypothetical protein
MSGFRRFANSVGTAAHFLKRYQETLAAQLAALSDGQLREYIAE